MTGDTTPTPTPPATRAALRAHLAQLRLDAARWLIEADGTRYRCARLATAMLAGLALTDDLDKAIEWERHCRRCAAALTTEADDLAARLAREEAAATPHTGRPSEQQRLAFARWLAQHGRISEWPDAAPTAPGAVMGTAGSGDAAADQDAEVLAWVGQQGGA